jgi:hypothetical protein
MKQLLFILFVLLTTFANAQSKFEFGLSTEASWVMKKELTMDSPMHVGETHNWGTAFGVYAAVPVWWRFSLSSGLNFRYAKIQRGFQVYYDEEETGWQNIVYDFTTYNRYYLVVPLELRFRIFRKGFINGGIEYCRMLTDYSSIENNPEYNWMVGYGSHIGKLTWNLQYLRGFKEQIIRNYITYSDGSYSNLGYEYQTNRMQLNLSYPLWSK